MMVPDTHSGTAAVAVEELACGRGRRTVLREVSFAIRAGETVGIVGPNGSGKTTLVRTLAGLARPRAGRVLVNGQALHGLSPRRRARLVALVGQDEQPPADLRAGEVVALGLTPYLPPWGPGSPRERQAIENALRAVDLDGFAERPVDRMSGGERQRVLLARALVQDTPLLLLDEPTNHLDVTHRLALLELVRELDRTAVLALHDLALADRYCDRVMVVHNGTAGPLGPPEIALDPVVLAEVFQVRAARVRHPGTGQIHLLLGAERPDGRTEFREETG
ncbi:ABC transporter ATP-binding protein [Nocardia sp. CDC159]|uniref:ABC transporter ATP-binding protein n=1 Tax=Nocardia pulmonis TaxID=2951408 RepID=A0A9X2E2W2_9NOCA|nr:MULTISPECIES: ABC transporter ATP-binding protein [Nocardia]MCM6773262.1 ABC transporter ATP-binding protein [Nocardia pulmonis]MCM6786149.1 ABC transporter ATP-binding protein [Nocardia sp. CDC159]